MGRKLRSRVPMFPEMYQPELPPNSETSHKKNLYWSKQQSNFKKWHRTCQLKPLRTGDQVWILELHQQDRILLEVAPQSNLIQTQRGRNQQQFAFLDTTEHTYPNETTPVADSVIPTSSDNSPHHESPPPGATITRSGHEGLSLVDMVQNVLH